MITFISRFKYVFLILGLVGFIIFTNYSPHTWLTGWDTLHPELDYSLNFSRLISGVWRDEQGLGSVAGHSHMGDLPRVSLLYFFDLILPTSAVRYGYVFLMYLLGPLGIYFLIQHLFSKAPYKNLLAFLSSLYYMFNVGSVQQFFVPFEMFPTQFAYLPWIMLYSIKSLESFSKKNLFIFSLLTLLATPQAYAAQLWYAFFGTYLLSIAFYILLQKSNHLLHFRQGLTLLVLTLLLNSFWLFPNMYYISTQGETPRFAKQNRLYSQEFRQRNREFGRLQDVALLKGFYFNWAIFDTQSEQFDDLMPVWKNHYARPHIAAIGYAVFAMVLCGLCISFKKSNRKLLPFIPFFIIPFTLLANKVLPFSILFDQLIRIPLFEEALRFVFTKFSLLLIFSYTIFFAVTLAYLFEKINGYKKTVISALIVGGSFIILGWPAFNGHLISEKVRTEIPSEYFHMWNFMSTQPKGTVVTLPLHTFSGWQYYKWGYQGSGFIWFPLEQPVLDRDSDRWNKLNEEAFRELQYSLYSKDDIKLSQTLKKYNISYVLWDRNNTTTEEKNREQITFERETKDIVDKLVAKKFIKNIWSQGKIEIYEILPMKNTIEVLADVPNILPTYEWNFTDTAYNEFGVYKSDIQSNPDVFYPFRNYLNKFDRFNENLISINTEKHTYTINIPQTTLFRKQIKTPNLNVEKTINADVYIQKSSNKIQLIVKPILPYQHTISTTINLKKEPINSLRVNEAMLPVPTIAINAEPLLLGQSMFYLQESNTINGLLYDVHFDTKIAELPDISGALPADSINIEPKDIFNHNIANTNLKLLTDTSAPQHLRIQSKENANGVLIDLPDLSQANGYIVSLKTRNIRGIPIRICLFSAYANLCSLYDEASRSKEFVEDSFIIPPYNDASGYSLRLDNISYGNELTVNDIAGISIFPIPFNLLSQTYIETGRSTAHINTEAVYKSHFNHTLYAIEINADNLHNNELVFWRSFNDGWIAINVKSVQKLANHHRINNWANGWTIEHEMATSGRPLHIIIFFWPQLLEYAGFIIAAISLLSIGFFIPRKD